MQHVNKRLEGKKVRRSEGCVCNPYKLSLQMPALNCVPPSNFQTSNLQTTNVVSQMPPKRLGLVHVYTGDGKGKTTASLGLALRAIGQGFKVYIIQFLKGGAYTGELISVNNFLPTSDIVQYGKRCIKELKQYKLLGYDTGVKYFDYIREDIECGNCRECFLNDEEQRKLAVNAFRHAKEILANGEYDLVILDEINNAVHFNFINADEVIELIKNKTPHVELVLTGRNANQKIMEAADLVTEMKKIKHYFDRGVKARRGIEY